MGLLLDSFAVEEVLLPFYIYNPDWPFFVSLCTQDSLHTCAVSRPLSDDTSYRNRDHPGISLVTFRIS